MSVILNLVDQDEKVIRKFSDESVFKYLTGTQLLDMVIYLKNVAIDKYIKMHFKNDIIKILIVIRKHSTITYLIKNELTLKDLISDEKYRYTNIYINLKVRRYNPFDETETNMLI